MPADVTPTPFSTSKLLILLDDQVESRYAQIIPVNVTVFAASVNQTGEAMFGGRPIIYTQSYSIGGQSSSTYTVASFSGSFQYTVGRVVSSAPIVLVSVTQYHQVVTTNNTVWSSQNTSSNLLTALSGQGNDIVSYKVSLVADTVV